MGGILGWIERFWIFRNIIKPLVKPHEICEKCLFFHLAKTLKILFDTSKRTNPFTSRKSLGTENLNKMFKATAIFLLEKNFSHPNLSSWPETVQCALVLGAFGSEENNDGPFRHIIFGQENRVFFTCDRTFKISWDTKLKYMSNTSYLTINIIILLNPSYHLRKISSPQ